MKDKNKFLAIIIITGVLLLVLGAIIWFLLSGQSFSFWFSASFIALTILALLAVVFAILMWRGKIKREPDYYVIFMMGIIWFPLGFIFEMWPLSIMGIVFLAIGLKNKDKWKRKKWSEMEPGQRKLKIVLMIALGILVLGCLLVSLFY